MDVLARPICGASVDCMSTYDLGDSNPDPLRALVFVRQADLTPMPDLHCPQLLWRPSLIGTGVPRASYHHRGD
ncbi:hypothetical protein GCM10027610_058670 [Dactylosporangium cerinum]